MPRTFIITSSKSRKFRCQANTPKQAAAIVAKKLFDITASSATIQLSVKETTAGSKKKIFEYIANKNNILSVRKHYGGTHNDSYTFETFLDTINDAKKSFRSHPIKFEHKNKIYGNIDIRIMLQKIAYKLYKAHYEPYIGDHRYSYDRFSNLVENLVESETKSNEGSNSIHKFNDGLYEIEFIFDYASKVFVILITDLKMSSPSISRPSLKSLRTREVTGQSFVSSRR